MAIGSIVPFETSGNKLPGALKFAVQSGSAATIKAGEPVQKLAGAAYATIASTSFPTTTLRHVGIASSASTDTASADGTVDVLPSVPGVLWLVAPTTATSWNTQAKYNALVGSRCLLAVSGGVWTMGATDSAGNGCIIEYIDIATYPGMVCFSFSPLSYYANV